MLSDPTGIDVDQNGNVYISDLFNNIKKVDTNGIITSIGVDYEFTNPHSLVSADDGSVFVCDTNAHKIVKIAPDGSSEVIVGTGSSGYSGDDGQALNAQLYGPHAVALDGNSGLFIADTFNNVIRHVDLNNIITTVNLGVAISSPMGIAFDIENNLLYISDSENNKVYRKNLLTNELTLLNENREIMHPAGLEIDRDGNLIITETSRYQVLKLYLDESMAPNYSIEVIAGNGEYGYDENTNPLETKFQILFDVAVTSSGSVLVADPINSRIRKIDY